MEQEASIYLPEVEFILALAEKCPLRILGKPSEP